MTHPEKNIPLSIKELFPEALTAQSTKLIIGDEKLIDETPTRRCIAFICRDDEKLAEVHLNNGKEDPQKYAQRAKSRLKDFFNGRFKVIVVGGDELISQHFVDAVLEQMKNDDQIIFDEEHSDTGGVWVRHITVTSEGAEITRTEKSDGEPEEIKISFPEKG